MPAFFRALLIVNQIEIVNRGVFLNQPLQEKFGLDLRSQPLDNVGRLKI